MTSRHDRTSCVPSECWLTYTDDPAEISANLLWMPLLCETGAPRPRFGSDSRIAATPTNRHRLPSAQSRHQPPPCPGFDWSRAALGASTAEQPFERLGPAIRSPLRLDPES